MSIAVELAELADTIAQYRFAYLLTVSDGGRAHVAAVQPVLADGRLRVSGLGRRTRGNAAERPDVTLVWPPADIDGYSLIVDGSAELAGELMSMAPTRAVLHRPAPAPRADSPCRSDCVELPVTDDSE